jgi:hypothetical protein
MVVKEYVEYTTYGKNLGKTSTRNVSTSYITKLFSSSVQLTICAMPIGTTDSNIRVRLSGKAFLLESSASCSSKPGNTDVDVACIAIAIVVLLVALGKYAASGIAPEK